MSFREDVEATVFIGQYWRSGLKALRSADHGRVRVRQTRNLNGSVDIDTALKPRYPNSNRWDYVIALKGPATEELKWAEIHPASSGTEIKVVGQKRDWLRDWMADTPFLKYRNSYFWIATGKVCFTANHPYLKALAANGVLFRPRVLEL
jgi:hypothetical protein